MKPSQTILPTIGLIIVATGVWRLSGQETGNLRTDYSPRIKTYENGEREVEVKQVIPAPTNGVFWPLSGDFPPTPFGPNPQLKLPVYFWSDGTFLFDDENLDYHALKESGIPLFNTGNFSLKSGGMQMAAEGPPVPGEGGMPIGRRILFRLLSLTPTANCIWTFTVAIPIG